MDEAAYRQIYSEVIERPCAFEKAVLARCVACACSKSTQIAEREAVSCLNAPSLSRCTLMHEQLRHSFSFALGNVREDLPMPHAQEMRVQCGGLQGLQFVLNDNAIVENVDSLLGNALQKWGGISEIPYSEVVHAAALCYKGRRGR